MVCLNGAGSVFLGQLQNPVEMLKNYASVKNFFRRIVWKDGRGRTSFRVGKKLQVSYSIVALRNMPYSGMMSVKVKALADVDVDVTAGVEVPDGEYRNVSTAMRHINADGKLCHILHTDAETAYYQRCGSGAAHIYRGAISQRNSIGNSSVRYERQLRHVCPPSDSR